VREVLLSGKKAAGRVAKVDDKNYEKVLEHRWHVAQKPGQSAYAITTIYRDGKRTTITMHRLITGWPGRIDHRNFDGLDNQEHNLRPVTASESSRHRRKQRTPSSSRFIGVCWHRTNKKWIANVQVNGKRRHLGYFTSEEDAAAARDAVIEKMHGEFAVLNRCGVDTA
jgi:hypothetical protein